MALLKVTKKADEQGEPKSNLTPELIQSKLFYFHDVTNILFFYYFNNLIYT